MGEEGRDHERKREKMKKERGKEKERGNRERRKILKEGRKGLKSCVKLRTAVRVMILKPDQRSYFFLFFFSSFSLLFLSFPHLRLLSFSTFYHTKFNFLIFHSLLISLINLN